MHIFFSLKKWVKERGHLKDMLINRYLFLTMWLVIPLKNVSLIYGDVTFTGEGLQIVAYTCTHGHWTVIFL